MGCFVRPDAIPFQDTRVSRAVKRDSACVFARLCCHGLQQQQLFFVVLRLSRVLPLCVCLFVEKKKQASQEQQPLGRAADRRVSPEQQVILWGHFEVMWPSHSLHDDSVRHQRTASSPNTLDAQQQCGVTESKATSKYTTWGKKSDAVKKVHKASQNSNSNKELELD